MRCGDCHWRIHPETDRHVIVREQMVAPNLGSEATDGRALCADCGDDRVARDDEYRDHEKDRLASR